MPALWETWRPGTSGQGQWVGASLRSRELPARENPSLFWVDDEEGWRKGAES